LRHALQTAASITRDDSFHVLTGAENPRRASHREVENYSCFEPQKKGVLARFIPMILWRSSYRGIFDSEAKTAVTSRRIDVYIQ
jgi:hypothetical protein